MLSVGSLAPDFDLPTADGTPFRLRDHKGRPVVVFFYPKDETKVCTAEACAFRDQYEDFRELGAEVVGVSMDSEASHQRFAQKHRLPFPLLADVGGRVRKLYEVPRLFGFLPMSGRVTYVIAADGTIGYAFQANGQAQEHVTNTLALLRAWQAGNPSVA